VYVLIVPVHIGVLMQPVPLSADGRVTAVNPTLPVPGVLRVALEPDGAGVRVVAPGPVPRPVGRLAVPDAAAYAPVLRRLAVRGLVGTCPAEVRTDGALVLHLGPAPECVLGNAVGDLVLLTAERTVAVTREEHHQDVLAGRTGRVAVALQPCAVESRKHTGLRGIEVTLDGRRVGELTRLMAERYLPVVDGIVAGGRRAGCEALLRPDRRGVQVELRLPAVDATARPGITAPRPAAVPAPRAPAPPTALLPRWSPSGAPLGPAARTPGAFFSGAPVTDRAAPPWPAPGPTVVLPGPRAVPPPTIVAPRPSAPVPPGHAGPPRGRRRVVWAGAAAVGVLLLAAAVGNGAGTAPPAPTTAAAAASRAAPPAAPAPISTPPSPAPAGTARAAAGAGAAVVAPAERATTRTTRTEAAKPAPRSATAKPSTTTRAAKPSTTTRAAEPSTTTRAVQAEPAPVRSGCDPNYSGCVPIAADVDCEGGSGDGPAYVRGPVRVVGKDVYGLDRGGEPGVGCE
jgi:hypothetical protein